jgi:hypothetical protein
MKKTITLGLIIIFSLQLCLPVLANVVLSIGTIIQLECIETVTSENAIQGQRVRFRVVNDVKVDNQIVIKAGTLAYGEVVSVEGKGSLGKPGNLSIQFRNVTASDGTIIPISASKIIKGKDKQTEAILVTLILCVFGLFIKGEDASLQAGTIIQADTISDVTIGSEIETNVIVSEEKKETVEIKSNMIVRITTTEGENFSGLLSSKKDDKLYILNNENITITDNISETNITNEILEMEDFDPVEKYNWNSLIVREIF